MAWPQAFASRLMSLMLEDMISEGVKSESEGNHSTDNELDIRHSTDSSPQGSSYVEAAKKLQQAQSAVTTSLVSFPAARSPLESRELETLIGLTLQKLAPNDEEGTSSEQVSAAIQTLRVMGSEAPTPAVCYPPDTWLPICHVEVRHSMTWNEGDRVMPPVTMRGMWIKNVQRTVDESLLSRSHLMMLPITKLSY
jgi:hypothetical protein